MNYNLTTTYLICRKMFLYTVVKTKVDHIKSTIASNRCRHPLIQSVQTQSVFANNFSGNAPRSRSFFQSISTKKIWLFKIEQIVNASQPHCAVLACMETLTTSNGLTIIASVTPAPRPASENVY